MHKLNFCGTLCLPKEVEGHKARGMNIVHSFGEAHIIPMARPFTENHVIYATRPTIKNVNKADSYIANLKEPIDLEKHKEWMFKELTSADHSLDLDPEADYFFFDRDESLKYVAEKLLSKGNDKVVIWSNNGIGPDSDGKSDGVLRDKEGIAYGCILKGEKFDQYQKGIPGSYQNSAHAHIHIAPTSNEKGFDQSVIPILEAIHGKKVTATLNDYRNMAREDESLIPCISAAVIDKDSIDKKLEFTHYSAPHKFAGLVRFLTTNHSNLVENTDFNDKEVIKYNVDKTADFYGSNL